MPRWLVALVLAILMPCYGFAAVGQSLAVALDNDSHAAAHVVGEPHHHHDDGAFHADDSDDSVQHLHAADWMASPALIVGNLSFAVTPPVFEAMRPSSESPPPDPYLKGLKRPPRSIAA